MSNWDSVNLEHIARELKSIRRVLERMAQAPIFIKDSPLDVREVDKADVAYVCDGKACSYCLGDKCMHTSKIDHALHFKKQKDGRYVEIVR